MVIDLDPQQGSLTYLLGISPPRDDGDADNIACHLADRPKGSFTDLIHETPFGFDIVPSHNMLEILQGLLAKLKEMIEDLEESFNPNDRLR